MYRLVVMVSGNGSNLQALIDNVHRNAKVDAEIALVVCSKDGVKALERAAEAGIPTSVVALADPSDREERDARLNEAIGAVDPDLIVMAGWMSIVTGVFLGRFPDKVINLHPSLLPAFPGMHAIQDRPVGVDGQIVLRPMMYLALSYDHRIIDGREAVSFLVRIKELVEAPERMLLGL
jgi:phosphoribosylglycinamide formyltransferase-1